MTFLAQNLRRKATKEENKIWYQYLSKCKYSFRRQYVIENYIVDFYCAKAKLAIELDGSQHYEPQKKIYDQIRTEHIENYGIEVLRFSNQVVNKQFKELCEYLDVYLERKTEGK